MKRWFLESVSHDDLTNARPQAPLSPAGDAAVSDSRGWRTIQEIWDALCFSWAWRRVLCAPCSFLEVNSLRFLPFLKFRIIRQSTFKRLHDDSRAESGATTSPFAPFIPRGLWQAIKSGSTHLINTKKKCLVGEWSGNVCEVKQGKKWKWGWGRTPREKVRWSYLLRAVIWSNKQMHMSARWRRQRQEGPEQHSLRGLRVTRKEAIEGKRQVQTRLRLEKPEQEAGLLETWGSPTLLSSHMPGHPDPCGVTDASPQSVENILHQEDSAQVDWLNFCLDR